MSAREQELNNRQQRKKKMSKAQMQLAIVKKKQCDKKALAIVQQLIEPDVDTSWLLQNLGFISKSHMEDAIEERAITKLCGYILCSKPITIVIKQQYHISTRSNKVYDISRRKNFCSSSCYGASNYLLEQMLESPLWLRDKEDIPIFQILPVNPIHTQSGDEIDVVEISLLKDIDINDTGNEKKSTGLNRTKWAKQNASSTLSNSMEEHGSDPLADANSDDVKNISMDKNLPSLDKVCLSELNTKQEEDSDSRECVNSKNNDCDIKETNVKLETLETWFAAQFENALHLRESDNKDVENKNEDNTCNSGNNNSSLEIQLNEVISNQSDVSENLKSQSRETNSIENDNSEMLATQSNEINNDEYNESKKIQLRSDEACNNRNTVTIPKSCSNEHTKERKGNKINKIKKCKQKASNTVETQDDVYYKLTAHVEQSVKEWVTKDTLCLLLNDTDKKSQLFENLVQQERYQQLCKKLNRLQLQDEQKDRINLKKSVLKPPPHISVLQEEGKKMELKVRAFYEGQITIISSEDDNNESENKDTDNNDRTLPLIDARAPNAIRRRILSDKLIKILPNLLHTLTAKANISTTVTQYDYSNKNYLLIRLLINTFNLSAANIVFKTAEWTLIGLIIIKMLSLIDTQLQSLLASKQATMYTSMILTSYKLDTNYLDRLIMEAMNNVDLEKSK